MFDLIIIGGGPGGYHMAEKAASAGMKAVVIEGDSFGGTCLNRGCIPSKAFLHFSAITDETNENLEKGIIGQELSVDQSKVVDYKDEKVQMLVKGTEMQVKGSGAEIIKGWAKILPMDNDVFQVEVNGDTIQGKKLVIATGSKTFIPGFIKGAEQYYDKGNPESKVLTSDEILSMKTIPENLVVVGAGIIGLELGSYFNSVGSNVTLIDVASKVAGAFDNDMSKLLLKAKTKDGMKFILNSKVLEITDKVVIYEKEDGTKEEVAYDKVLVSVGRKPNTDDLGLENIEGLNVEHGFVRTDDKLETNVKNVFAIGDVNGVSMLAHTAYREGEIIVENLLGGNSVMNYDYVPSVLYGKLEMAEIGINEDRAKAENLDVTVKKLPFMFSGRFAIEVPKFSGEHIKVIIDNKSNKIIGMSLLGKYSSEIINMASVIIGEQFEVDQVKKLIFAHPTVSEIMKDVIFHK